MDEFLQLKFLEDKALQPLVGYGSGKELPVEILTATISIDGEMSKVNIHVIPKES